MYPVARSAGGLWTGLGIRCRVAIRQILRGGCVVSLDDLFWRSSSVIEERTSSMGSIADRFGGIHCTGDNRRRVVDCDSNSGSSNRPSGSAS